MSKQHLHSYRFRSERQALWQETENLINTLEKKGLKTLSAEQRFRLPSLYRATLSSLSVARATTLDKNLLDYLESLAARAFFATYSQHVSFMDMIVQFFLHGFPAAVRQLKWFLLISFAVGLGSVLVAYILTMQNLDWYYTFMSGGLAADRTPSSSTQSLRDGLFDGGGSASEMLQIFASQLFSNNAGIVILFASVGVALGFPVFILLFSNGTMMGSFIALYSSNGLLYEIGGWLSIHGTTEILAILLCAAAGLSMGAAVAFPGQYSRIDNLARAGRLAGRVVLGAVFMMFVAAFLEGFGRQLINDTIARYIIGGTMLLFWAMYFTFMSRPPIKSGLH